MISLILTAAGLAAVTVAWMRVTGRFERELAEMHAENRAE